MIAREYGENTPKETRRESHELVDKEKRYEQIISCLLDRGQSTAKEIAVYMYLNKDIPIPERNYTAPRLTEMMEKGIVEPLGKKKCRYTGRMVTVYGLREV